MSFGTFTGAVHMASQAREPVPSLRRVYKSLTRIALLLFFITFSFHYFPKNRWHNFLMWPASLSPKKLPRLPYELVPRSFLKITYFRWLCLRPPSKRSSHRVSMTVALLSKTTLRMCHVGEERSGKSSKSQKRKYNGDVFMHPGAGFSFIPLLPLLAACP